jgi:hypothetical protein
MQSLSDNDDPIVAKQALVEEVFRILNLDRVSITYKSTKIITKPPAMLFRPRWPHALEDDDQAVCEKLTKMYSTMYVRMCRYVSTIDKHQDNNTALRPIISATTILLLTDHIQQKDHGQTYSIVISYFDKLLAAVKTPNQFILICMIYYICNAMRQVSIATESPDYRRYVQTVEDLEYRISEYAYRYAFSFNNYLNFLSKKLGRELNDYFITIDPSYRLIKRVGTDCFSSSIVYKSCFQKRLSEIGPSNRIIIPPQIYCKILNEFKFFDSITKVCLMVDNDSITNVGSSGSEHYFQSVNLIAYIISEECLKPLAIDSRGG